jgi:PAS domain S-box-containing protein
LALPDIDVGVPTILIVDDRPDNLFVMQAVFEDSPTYKVVTASSGFEAIELVKKIDLALILLDIQMPGMDGYQTAAAIKELERGKDVPIMMVSAIYKEDPHILQGYSAGAIDYIAKPFNPDILKAKVDIFANLYIKSRQISLQNRYLLEAEKALRDAKNIKAVIETMPVGVIVADKAGVIYQINREAARIWGGAKLVDINHYNEYVGWRLEDGEPIKSHEWPLARAIEKGETSQYEIILIQSFDGTRKTILNSAAPIRNEAGEISGAVDVMQDITQQENPEKIIRKGA